MENTEVKNVMLKGGEYLIKETVPNSVFIPEQYSEEQRMVADAAKEFVEQHVQPNLERLEQHDIELSKQLLEMAGDYGLLGTSVPEEYGGTGQDFITNSLLTENLSYAFSFALTIGAHTGIGTLPILYYGTEDQRNKYLPDLSTGRLKAAYCLTEPDSGSDALAAKTKAILSEDGSHYVLNGQKMWITNGGLADIFVVFAKINGTDFTGFIVESGYEGLTRGKEETKLGIKGSSTCQIFFENVKVPVENVLGDIGKGHKIAFNILNIGRIKLAAGVVGGSKMGASASIRYANERHQFKRPIGSFGAIQHKLAEQAVRIYAVEAATYRTCGNIQHEEERLLEDGKSYGESLLGAAEEFAIECALLKVAGSEVLDYVVDEAVQIHGGIGYSEEGPVARAYRDARINRIFEGTNEINRMLAVDMLLKRTMKGKIDLITAAQAVQKELMTPPSFGNGSKGELFDEELKAVKNMKKATLLVAGATTQKLMAALEDEQEILMYISDMMADAFIAESVLLRTKKLVELKGEAACVNQLDLMRVYISDAMERLGSNGRKALKAWAENDELRMLLLGLKRFTKFDGINTKNARRRIAATLLEANEYCF